MVLVHHESIWLMPPGRDHGPILIIHARCDLRENLRGKRGVVELHESDRRAHQNRYPTLINPRLNRPKGWNWSMNIKKGAELAPLRGPSHLG